ncbi:MAG: FtsW/RodA/SpoVE family cell cycle protein [Bacteroidales bacterium]|jgi:cell division protein FtsW|nr:FtsW/RodA/SpoVE family cell cycle protein [Bacteroidales bacterium]
MSWINKILKGDRVIWVVMLILGIISLLAVYSATSSEAHVRIGAYNEKVLLKHAATLMAGFVMMFIASRINYRHYSRAIELVLMFCFILLIFTYFFGSRINGASRSIMGFQTSELAKIVLIAYLAKYIVVWNNRDYTFKNLIVPIFLPIVLIVGPIFPENLSTAAMLFVVCIVMLYIGQIKFSYLMALIGIVVLGMGLYILTDDMVANIKQNRYEKVVAAAELHPEDAKLQEKAKKKPRISRVKTWQGRIEAAKEEREAKIAAGIDPEHSPLQIDDRNAQKMYAKIAVARGGLFGKGSGKSTQRNFLPQPFSDCIYAIIIEEYGLVGGIFVMLLYIILLTRSVRIMKKRPLTFGALMAFGIAFILIMQAMINMGVSTGLMPVTGQQLPFVSRGGSSMLMTGFAVGMILSVTRSLEETPIVEQKTETEEVIENEEMEVAHEE